MKKNVIGRVLAQKQPVSRRISALHIPARILCLLLAVVIWLAVSNLSPEEFEHEDPYDTTLENEA